MTEKSTGAPVRERRIELPSGAMLVDEERGIAAPERLFEVARWESAPAPRGRGSARFVTDGSFDLVWRAFRRGGLVARVVRDRYLFLGEARVRSFAEWRLLAHLHGLGLPVPRPVAARYRRAGPAYVADLMTERITGVDMLSSRLAADVPIATWRAVGRCIRQFHAAGACHADLNAHNILLRGDGDVYLIDFDRGRLRAAGAWTEQNLHRLRRSLDKLAPGSERVAAGWPVLLAAYAEADC